MYQITSIFYMYIDSGERIAEKHDGSTMIIEGSPNNKKNCSHNEAHIYEKSVVIFFHCCHCCRLSTM